MTSQVLQRQSRQLVIWRWLAVLVLPIMTDSMMPITASADLHRLYDFEEGTAGNEALSVADTIADTHLVPAFGTFLAFDNLVPGTNDAVPGDQPVQTWITDNVNPTPSLDAVLGAGSGPTFVDVSDGMAIDSPAPGSTLAVQFDGFSQVVQGPGFRDSYVDAEAYNNDALAGGNIATTFFNFSQSWVYPSSSGQGLNQTVWAIGNENGGVRISANGFWELTAVGGATINPSINGVDFDEWTHIAVSRGGGGATLYVNGSVAATASGSFGIWGPSVTLGSDEALTELFNGVVDNFGVGGNHEGMGFVPFEDIAFFADLGIPQPTGVAGDVDQDGDADIDDYNIWSANKGFNNGFGAGDVTTLLLGDLNNDGRIDFFDFTEIASAAAAAGAALQLDSAAVPEPSALVLAAMGVLAIAMGRRK